MPNSRRRKFSVQNDLGNKNKKNRQQVSTSSTTADRDLKTGSSQNELSKPSKNLLNLNKINTNQPVPERATNPTEGVTLNDCKKNATFVPEVKISSNKNGKTRSSRNSPEANDTTDVKVRSRHDVSEVRNMSDKYVTASSSSIDLMLQSNEDSSDSRSDKTNNSLNVLAKDKENISSNRQRNHIHKAKVRSPRRRATYSESKVMTINFEKCDISTSSSNLIQEVEKEVACDDILETVVTPTIITEENNYAEELSSHSLGDMCRICHGGETLTSEFGSLISACSCRGTVGRVHVKCLERWLTESGKSRCELCATKYTTRRVHRYGVPRALFMWIMSQNAKQLMVDSLGIMLMSPLAVLAAWLSGRTLAGLMAQEPQTTPWPLASTFVLACMTLVCYYCWIVSAATRHALGWWLWYRSQYEVRLALEN